MSIQAPERTEPEIDPITDRFASRSVPVHVARGVVGAALAVAAFVLAAQGHPLGMLLLVPAVVAWRGCPTCWLMGLGATITRGRINATCRT